MNSLESQGNIRKKKLGPFCRKHSKLKYGDLGEYQLATFVGMAP
jgi:hypothetical protein